MDHSIIVTVGNRRAEDHHCLRERAVWRPLLLGRFVIAERFSCFLYVLDCLFPERDVFLFTKDHGNGGLRDAGVLSDISCRDFVSLSHGHLHCEDYFDLF